MHHTTIHKTSTVQKMEKKERIEITDNRKQITVSENRRNPHVRTHLQLHDPPNPHTAE